MTHIEQVSHDIESLLRPDSLLGALGYLVLFCLIAWLLSRALRVTIATAVSHASDHVDRTAVNFLRQLGVLIIWIFVLALYAHLIPALRALGTAMLAGASVASIVLGLAAQTTLGNLVAGISILIYRPFRLGDLLQIAAPTGPEIGTVEVLSLGYTVLATQDGRKLIVPNSLAISQIAVNLNAFATDNAHVITFWAPRDRLVSARAAAIAFAQQHGAHVVGCFVVKSEPAAVQLSLALRPAPAHSAPDVIASLPQQLATTLAHLGIGTPSGKDAPQLVAG
jgi:small conductance mechanosensitive channel